MKVLIILLILGSFCACKKDKSPQDLSIHNDLISGGGSLSFQRIVGGDRLDDLYSVKQTSDGGYIFCGLTENDGASERDVLLLRTNNKGETIWLKRFSDNFSDEAYSLDLTSDNGFILATTSSLTTGTMHTTSYSYYSQLIKTDSEGNLLWKKSFNFGKYTNFSSIKVASDGGYILCGSEFDSNSGIILRTDASGNEVWRKTITGNIHLNGMDTTNDGGFVFCGSIKSIPSVSDDIYLMRTNSFGDSLWTKTYGDNLDNVGRAIVELANGNLILCGYSSNPGSTGFAKLIDSNGIEIWNKDFINLGVQFSENIKPLSNNAFILIGYSQTALTTATAYLFKIDDSGNNVWHKTFNPGEYTLFNDIRVTGDNGFVMAGYSKSGSNGNAFIVKTDSNGN